MITVKFTELRWTNSARTLSVIKNLKKRVAWENFLSLGSNYWTLNELVQVYAKNKHKKILVVLILCSENWESIKKNSGFFFFFFFKCFDKWRLVQSGTLLETPTSTVLSGRWVRAGQEEIKGERKKQILEWKEGKSQIKKLKKIYI